MAIIKSLFSQLFASIKMMENAISVCPEQLWKETNFWYISYHTLFYLDYYITEDPSSFAPPFPFTLSEFDPNGEMPDRVYSQQELLDYLEYSGHKGRELMNSMTEFKLQQLWKNEYRESSLFELIIYNTRHVQHHVGQLNMLLRQNGVEAPRWVSK